jgi:hypothetical protein
MSKFTIPQSSNYFEWLERGPEVQSMGRFFLYLSIESLENEIS